MATVKKYSELGILEGLFNNTLITIKYFESLNLKAYFAKHIIYLQQFVVLPRFLRGIMNLSL